MASIRKTKSGSYKATIYLGRDINGKQQFRYITCSTLKETKAVSIEVEYDIANNSYIPYKNKKFVIFMNEWLELKKSSISPSTFLSYRMYIDKHFSVFFKNNNLASIDEIKIKMYISQKLKTLSPTTVRKHFFILKEILYSCFKLKSPCRDIKPPKAEKFSPRVLSDLEFNLIRAKITKTDLELPFMIAAGCGLRLGEIFALEWKDIDFKNSFIKVYKNMAISENGYIIKKPKSDNGTRVVPCPNTVMKILKSYRKVNSIGLIFNIRPDSFSEKFRKFLKLNKLPLIRFHDLRHYFMILMYKNGLPDLYAAKIAGHDVMTAKRTYQHIQDDLNVEFDNKVKNLL